MKYINLDIKDSYYIFNSFKVLSELQTISINNIQKCCSVNCKEIIKKHNEFFVLPELKIGTIKSGYIRSSGFIYINEGILHSALQFNKNIVKNMIEVDKKNKVKKSKYKKIKIKKSKNQKVRRKKINCRRVVNRKIKIKTLKCQKFKKKSVNFLKIKNKVIINCQKLKQKKVDCQRFKDRVESRKATIHSQKRKKQELKKRRESCHRVEIVKYDKVVPLLRAGDHIYGHWLLDILPIVWLSRRYENIEDYKYIVRANIPPFALELLSYFDVKKDNLIFIDNNVKLNFNVALFVSNMRYDQAIHPMMKEFADELSNKIMAREDKAGTTFTNSKVYFSRDKWKSGETKILRELNNTKEVESMFKKNSFVIVYPEELTLKEQIKLCSNIDILAGEDGSALHNSMFMREGTEVICLKGKRNHTIIQGSLCYVMGQKISYIIGEIDDEQGDRNSAYTIENSDLNKFFKEY